MRPGIVRDETLVEYFRQLVDAALGHQRVEALDLTAYYLVQLLATFARAERAADAATQPLALRLGRALQAGGTRQRSELKQVGDESLFLSGFFSDSLRRSLVDVDYYASLGGYAYGSLSGSDELLGPVYGELSAKFTAFADVLNEVSSQSALTSDTDLLRLYERWARGSRRGGELLAKRGILPHAQAGRFLTQ